MADHVANADSAILGRHLIAKEQHFGGVGIHLYHLMAGFPEVVAQADPAVDQFPDD